MFKIALFTLSTGGTIYTLYAWKDLSPVIRALTIAILITAFLASLPEAIRGVTYASSYVPWHRIHWVWGGFAAQGYGHNPALYPPWSLPPTFIFAILGIVAGCTAKTVANRNWSAAAVNTLECTCMLPFVLASALCLLGFIQFS